MSALPKPIVFILIGCFILFIGLAAFSFQVLFKLGNTKKPVLSELGQEKTRFSKSANGQEYQRRMIEYYSMQSMAVNIFPIDTALANREKSMSDIKDIGIYYWDRNLELLTSLKELELPKELADKTEQLKQYCQLNKACYALMYKSIDERTNRYDKEIKKQFEQIAEQMALIKANHAP